MEPLCQTSGMRNLLSVETLLCGTLGEPLFGAFVGRETFQVCNLFLRNLGKPEPLCGTFVEPGTFMWNLNLAQTAPKLYGQDPKLFKLLGKKCCGFGCLCFEGKQRKVGQLAIMRVFFP